MGQVKKTSSTIRKVSVVKRATLQDASSRVADAQTAYIAKEKAKVIDFMGITGKKSASDVNDENYLIEIIRKGIPKKVIDTIMTRTGLTEDEMSSVLHVSKRTIQRRVPQEVLNPEQSERLVELAKLYSRGKEVFGDINIFKEWMDREILTLGNRKPKEFLDTSIGFNILLDELGRIEHGVYS